MIFFSLRSVRRLSLNVAGSASVGVGLATVGGIRLEFDHVVDTQDRDGGLGGELERLDLRHGRLEHASLRQSQFFLNLTFNGFHLIT